MNMYLSEAPHILIQGEGINVGTKMIAIRCAGCDLQCYDCDSSYTWENMNYPITYTIKELAGEILYLSNTNDIIDIMITGGEPGLQIQALSKLISDIGYDIDMSYHIETAGHIDFSELNFHSSRIYYAFSPKIGSLKSNNNVKWLGISKGVNFRYIVKIVVSKENWVEDLSAIKQFQKEYHIPNNRIYLMPKGITREEVIENSKFVIDKAIKEKYQFTSRQHILIYDDKRLV